MIRCDEYGVPKIVQSIQFDPDKMLHEATLFNGRVFTANLAWCYAGHEMHQDNVIRDVENLVETRFRCDLMEIKT